MTTTYIPHATDWLMVGELVGSVLLIVLFLMAYCTFWNSFGEAEHDK